MRINNNLSALTAFNALTANTNALSKTIRQLSTGLRINSAADDASGLAISENLRAQTSGLARALQNVQDGMSLLQTAEGALGETNSMLQRMRELAVQAANDTLTAQDRSYLQMEIDALKNNIDSIAGNTKFNGKRLLDGSCCGMVEASDAGVKGYVRGAIQAEGNYRIELKAKPGAAQVQKSTIFKVKHENVVTDEQLNADNGIGDVEIESIPAGNYSITATKAGGGQTTTTYISTTTVNVESGNTSGVAETLLIRLTGEDENGNELFWPSFYYGSPYYSDDGNYYYRVSIPKDSDKQDVASLIKNQLNGRQITLCSNYWGNNPTNFTLKAETDNNGNCTITSTSTEGKLSRTQFTILPGTTSEIDPLRQTENKQIRTAELTGRVERGNTGSSSETINISINYNGTSESLDPITVPANTSEDDIAALLKNIDTTLTISGETVRIKGEPVAGASSYYKLSAIAGDDKNISITTSITSSNPDPIILFPDTSTSSMSYTTGYSGTVTHGNTSSNTERVNIRLSYYDNGTTRYSNTIYKDIPAETDKEGLAQIIADTVHDNGSMTINGERVLIESSHTAGTNDFFLRAVGASKSMRFEVFFSAPDGQPSTSIVDEDSSTNITDTMFTTEESSITAPAATTSLTGFYGDKEAADSLSVDVNTSTENNASILFEVTASAFDEALGTGTLTLSAQSHVLASDGTTANYADNKIIFSTNSTDPVDISSLLGEDAGHISLKLDPSKFKVGDKFVYNISGNGSRANPVDTSIYINGSQDSSWAKSWGNKDYVTYENNRLYYNMNAEAVSNREIHFRNFYLDTDNGRVHDGNISLKLDSDFGTKAAGFPDAPANVDTNTNELTLASFTANYVGKIAGGGTKLRDLEQFWNKQTGVFMLESPQTITISQGDGKKTSITLYSSDTLNDVRDKLNNAIYEGLDQGQYIAGGYANNLVTFVETPDTGSGLETVKGTFLIRSVIPGSSGRLTFSSAYGDLVDALGLNTVQEAEECSYSASVYNAHTGAIVASNVNTSGNMLYGAVDSNIDIEFNAALGVNARWSDKDKNFMLVPDSEYTAFIHVTKNNISFQTGANEKEEVALDIGDMSSYSLGISGVNVMTHNGASRSITILDYAIRKVSAQRTKIGSCQNALEASFNNITIANTNLTAADSRIRDADMSKSMLDLVKFQILNQSTTSMLAQANQLPRYVMDLMQ